MKNSTTLIARTRVIALVLLTFLVGQTGFSQDTLHLYYHHTQMKAHDTTLAKIDAWVKKLNGKHQDITVIAYFHKPEFKKFSQERADEMFLILNRKARELITIESIGPKKGKDSQRTTVDIIYKKTVNAEEAAAMATKAKAEEEKKKEDEKTAAAEAKKAKEKDKPIKESKEPETKKSKSEVAAEQTTKDDGKEKKPAKGSEEENKGKEGKMEDDVDKDVAFSNVVKYGEGYEANLAEIKYIQRAKFIVAETGKQNMDENFIKAVRENWKINSEISVMPYEDAKKLANENKKDTIVILSIAQVKTWFVVKTPLYEYRVLKLGRALCIENAKSKTLYKHFIPTVKEKGVTMECLVFGVSSMNYVFNFMLANKIDKSTRVPFLLEENAKELKNKTLVIGESMMHPKFPLADISKYYSGKVSIVSDQEAKDVILNKKDVAYVMPVKLPNTAGNYFYYIVDGATGKVYLYDEGPSFQMAINYGVTKNLDPSQSGYVDKANFQRFEKSMQGDTEKDAKRSEKANRERESVDKKEKQQADKQAKADAYKQKEEEKNKAKEEKPKKEKK